ncbi:hypothetical protein SAMN05428959_10557 [Duganella sp. CF517]|uniref:hypothetical protein n=1 Tax=Duganella sp. CF517 TaxID=1881038 RepID=UPI0008BEB779|nr:hypothetical protein [Duganella sp. CF517]SEO15579.1 hypothetical protein SAMN05428959_10557 [Duganella sp. CF517]
MTTVLKVNPAAQEQAAMHRTKLLLARCRGCTPPLVTDVQTRWHQQRQAHFLAWLEAGGFAQSDPERHHEDRQREAVGHALRDGGPAPDLHADTDPAMLRPIENSGIAPLFSVP